MNKNKFFDFFRAFFSLEVGVIVAIALAAVGAVGNIDPTKPGVVAVGVLTTVP